MIIISIAYLHQQTSDRPAAIHVLLYLSTRLYTSDISCVSTYACVESTYLPYLLLVSLYPIRPLLYPHTLRVVSTPTYMSYCSRRSKPSSRALYCSYLHLAYTVGGSTLTCATHTHMHIHIPGHSRPSSILMRICLSVAPEKNNI